MAMKFFVLLGCLTALVSASVSNHTHEDVCHDPSSCKAPQPTRKRTWTPPLPQGPNVGQVPAVGQHSLLNIKIFVPKVHQDSDHFQRFMDTIRVQSLDDQLVYLPKDGDLATEQVQEAFKQADNGENNTIFVYVKDPTETLILGVVEELSRNFQRQPHGLIIPATTWCRAACAFPWPIVDENQDWFGDVTALIGYSANFVALLDSISINLETSKLRVPAQKQIISLFLDEDLRESLGMTLDYGSEFVQNLRGLDDRIDTYDLQFDFNFHGENDTRVYNPATRKHPWMITSGGNNKLLTALSNYVPMKWHPDLECLHCVNSSTVPSGKVVTTLLVEETSPFLNLSLDAIAEQTLPSSQKALVIAVVEGPSSSIYQTFIDLWLEKNQDKFSQVAVLSSCDVLTCHQTLMTKALSIDGFEKANVMYLQSTARLMNSKAYAHLLNENRSVIAPMLKRSNTMFSNFWGAVDGDFDGQCRDKNTQCEAWAIAGECKENEKYMSYNCPAACGVCVVPGPVTDVRYIRSWDYMDIAQRAVTGVWSVPFATSALLLRRDAAEYLATKLMEQEPLEEYRPIDWYFSIAAWLRQEKYEINVDNQEEWGLLINPSSYDHRKPEPELFMLIGNKEHWADVYLHPEYNATKQLEFVQGRCWDIYNFPLFTEKFCQALVHWSEVTDLWSGGQTSDKRLKGGYEPVPTRDIHFNQMDFQETWTYILRTFVAPVVETQWVGYTLSGRETLDFIVKYQPEGQPFLRKHHDASTFSLNVALNNIGVDFEGGGTRFTRQNCTVLTNKVGHALVHPGRLTHEHEGLYVTKGTRYIIVSFVDQT